MANYKWPNVYPSIKDLSGVVATNSGTSCGYVGEAEFGPINKPTLLSSLNNYTSIFGSLNSAKYGYAGYSLAVASESIDSHYFVRVVKAGEEGAHEEDDAKYASVKVPAKGNSYTTGYGWYVEEVSPAMDQGDSSGFFNSSTYEIATVSIASAGTGYALEDTLNIPLGDHGIEEGVATVTGLTSKFHVSAIVMDTTHEPSGYADGDEVIIDLDTTDARFALTVTEGQITGITVVEGGESSVDLTAQSFEALGGTGTGLYLLPTFTNNGEIASISLTNTGETENSTVDTPIATTTSGTGTGATVNVTLDNRDLLNAFIVVASNPNNLKFSVRVTNSTINTNRAYMYDTLTYTAQGDNTYKATITGVNSEIFKTLQVGDEIELSRSNESNGVYTVTAFTFTQTDESVPAVGTIEFVVTASEQPVDVSNGKISNYPKPNSHTFQLDVLQQIGRVNTVVESYQYCTLYPAKDNYGNSIFVEDVINGSSNYINVFVNPNLLDVTEADTVLEPVYSVTTMYLEGGQSGGRPSTKDLNKAWSLFNDRSQTYVTLLLNSGYSNKGETSYQNAMLEVAEKRRDCFCLFDIPMTEVEYEDAIDWRKNILGTNSYRGALSSPWVRTYDSVQGRAGFVMCPSAFIAKLIGAAGDPWNAPAGPNRGIISSATVSPTGLTQAYDDVQGGNLYADNQINCIIRDTGAGYVNWGQRTLQQKPSSLDRINVARTIIYIETVLRDAARWHLFENNTPYERMQITLQFSSFLDRVLAAGGIANYKVICDNSNNPPIVIQNNQLVIDIIITPVYAAESIILNTTIVGEDASVSVTSSAN